MLQFAANALSRDFPCYAAAADITTLLPRVVHMLSPPDASVSMRASQQNCLAAYFDMLHIIRFTACFYPTLHIIIFAISDMMFDILTLLILFRGCRYDA